MVLILTDCPFLIGGSEKSFKYLVGFHWLTRRSECSKCAKYFLSSRTSYSHHRSNRQYYVCNYDVLQCYYIYQMVVVSMISIYVLRKIQNHLQRKSLKFLKALQRPLAGVRPDFRPLLRSTACPLDITLLIVSIGSIVIICITFIVILPVALMRGWLSC